MVTTFPKISKRSTVLQSTEKHWKKRALLRYGFWDCRRISLLILSKLINFLFPLKSWETHDSDDYRRNRNWLIHLNLRNIRSEIWQRLLNNEDKNYTLEKLLTKAKKNIDYVDSKILIQGDKSFIELSFIELSF